MIPTGQPPASAPAPDRVPPDLDRGLIALSTRRPVAMTMVVATVLVFGMISLYQLPQNLMPDISYPTVTVRTQYAGAAPVDVEDRISERLEGVLSQVKGLRRISSISRAEISEIILEFAWGTELGVATLEVREKIDQAILPDEVEKPTILRYDPTLDPVLQLGYYRERGPGAPPLAAEQAVEELIDLRIEAEETVEKDLELVPGVASVEVRGGYEKEIRIDVDEKRLSEKNLTMELISQRLAEENQNLASGMLYEGEQAYLVRAVNEFQDLEEIRNIVIRREGTIPIRLGDVADVRFGFKDPEVLTRYNGNPCIKIDVYKEADANLVEVARRVRNRIYGTESERKLLVEMEEKERLERELKPEPGKRAEEEEKRRRLMAQRRSSSRGGAMPPLVPMSLSGDKAKPAFLMTRLPRDERVVVMSDQSVFIERSLDEVYSTAISGGLLAIAILYFFLQNWWFTLIVGLSIPLSVIATFGVMNLFKVSLNIMSLGGLALGIGMLVDNSIVVLESIFRCREGGDAPCLAAVRGGKAVAGAVVASTLTTVAVFFPIVFVEGIAGQVFRDQSMTVVISLLASLAVSLTFVPMLVARRFSGGGQGGPAFHWRSNLRRYPSFRRLRAQARFARARGWSFFATHPLALLSLLGGLARSACKLYLEQAGSLLLEKRRALAWRRTAIVWQAPVFLALLAAALLQIAAFGVGTLILALAAGAALSVRLAGAASARLFKLGLGPFLRGFDRAWRAFEESYAPIIRFALQHRGRTILIAAAAALFSGWLLAQLGSELIPEVHQGEFTLELALPVGTRIERTDELILPLERQAQGLAGVQSIAATVGVEKDSLKAGEEGEHTARLLVRVKKEDSPQEVEERVKAELRRLFRDVPDLNSKIRNPVLFSFKTPIEVEIKGYNLARLREISNRLVEEMKQIPTIKDVKSNLQPGYPEVHLKFRRDLLVRHDFDVGKIGGVIRRKIEGEVPTRFPERDRKVDLRVRLREADRSSLEDLNALVVNPGEEAEFPLEYVAEIEKGEGPAEIRRIGQTRAAVVSANLAGLDLGRATRAIVEAINRLQVPPEFSVGFGGQQQEMEASRGSLLQALILAIFLVYVVMAAQFESLIQPFVIIFSIPLAGVGVAPVLWLLDLPLSVIVFLGLIILAGIVVNNAIVLIDCVNQLRAGGASKVEAIAKAGRIRLRPIFMTTSTTVLGLIPLTGMLNWIPGAAWLLGAGEGLEIRAPMAITVIAGLISSTLLTLVVVPVIYTFTDRRK
ncbi:MAG: efflux RND transporter permease subunit [Planctomycetes bacterium]|nr:efflux RND transporter permease subunit [Planctomycetota bacterium]